MEYTVYEVTEQALTEIKSVFRGEIFSKKKDGRCTVKATDAQAKIIEAYCKEGIIKKRAPTENE